MAEIEVKQLSEDEARQRGMFEWPIWSKEVSRFDWHYGETEECYVLEGHVIVETDDGQVEIRKGDYARFPAGLSCVWDVKEPIRKHYNFP